MVTQMNKLILLIGLFVLTIQSVVYGHSDDKLKPIAVEKLIQTSNSWNGKKLPNYAKGTPEITLLRIVVQPKTRLPLHTHPVINAGVLLKGSLTVTTEDNKVLNLNAGDPIVEVVNTWHYGENKGDEPAEIIVFYAGTKGTPITVKE
jgi:quercetin dioxygenase-like cupin family protein